MQGKKIKKLMANTSVTLGIVFIGFIILDWFNAYMNFIGNPISIKLLVLLCLSSMWNGVYLLKSED